MTASLPRAFGPYLLLARLGKGGAGSAYLARHRDEVHGASVDGRPLVVKILHPRLTQRPEFIKRFRHEADVAVRVSSPHVVRVLDAGRVGEQPYIAMDYIRGWTLSRLNSRMAETDVRMALALALEMTLQTLQGLVALHEATDRAGRPLQTVHRDLAPKNLMVGDDGRVRLIDLGLGKSNAQDWKTGTGTVMGSPGYMAPEQVTGDPVDQRTDLYAVGVILHELLTGQRYVRPGPPLDMLRIAMSRKYAAPSTIRRDVPAAVDAIVARAMARPMADRFATARAFIDAVQAQLSGRPGAAGVERLVDELMSSDAQARDVELQRLLGQSPPDGPEPEVGTEIYVRHPQTEVQPASTHVQTRVGPTRSWTPALTPPRSRAPVVAAAALGGFVAGIAVMLVAGRAWMAPSTSPPTDGAARREPDGPGGPSRSMAGPPPTAPAPSATLPAARPLTAPAPPPPPAPDPDAPRPHAAPPTGPRDETVSSAPSPASPSRPKSPSSAVRRARRQPAKRRTSARPAAANVAQRIARLQSRVSAAMKSYAPDDPRRGAMVRLLGRLSMVQAGATQERAAPQIDAFEREFRSIIKDRAGTSAGPR